MHVSDEFETGALDLDHPDSIGTSTVLEKNLTVFHYTFVLPRHQLWKPHDVLRIISTHSGGFVYEPHPGASKVISAPTV